MNNRKFLNALELKVLSRQRILPILVVFTLVLAGCTTGTSVNDSTPIRETPTPTRTTTIASDTTTAQEPETQKALVNSENHIQSTQVPPETQDQLHSSLSNLFATLPENQTERNQKVTEIGTSVCNNLTRVNFSALRTTAGYHKQTYKVVHGAKAVDKSFNANLDSKKIERQMGKTQRITSKASKYAPIIGAYNRFYDASCAVKHGESGSKEDFYIATATLTTEAVLVQQQVFYEASFRATGIAANKLSLMKIRRYCDCYSLVLHQVHWGVRGTLTGGADYVIQKSMEENISISEEDIDSKSINATLRQEYRNLSTRGANTAENKTKTLQRCVESAKKESKENGFGGFLNDAVSDVLNGDVSGLLDSAGEVQYKDLPEDIRNDVKQCMQNED